MTGRTWWRRSDAAAPCHVGGGFAAVAWFATIGTPARGRAADRPTFSAECRYGNIGLGSGAIRRSSGLNCSFIESPLIM
jgi:hypothetical protein